MCSFGTKPPWVTGIQVCTNEGPRLLQGEITINWRKYIDENLTSSRTERPISTKFGIKNPWVKRIQVCSNEGPRLSPRRDN